MKTRDWLQILPEPYRTEALANSDDEVSELTETDYEPINLAEALGAWFVWDGTPQGHGYWSQVAQWASGNAELPPPFTKLEIKGMPLASSTYLGL